MLYNIILCTRPTDALLARVVVFLAALPRGAAVLVLLINIFGVFAYIGIYLSYAYHNLKIINPHLSASGYVHRA